MFAHRFRRILLSQDEFKISSTLLELFAHRLLVFFKSLQSLEIGLHLVTWDRDLATKDTCHPHLPLHVPIAMKISTVIPCHYTASFCAIRQDKIKQTYCDGIYGNDSVF